MSAGYSQRQRLDDIVAQLRDLDAAVPFTPERIASMSEDQAARYADAAEDHLATLLSALTEAQRPGPAPSQATPRKVEAERTLRAADPTRRFGQRGRR